MVQQGAEIFPLAQGLWDAQGNVLHVAYGTWRAYFEAIEHHCCGQFVAGFVTVFYELPLTSFDDFCGPLLVRNAIFSP